MADDDRITRQQYRQQRSQPADDDAQEQPSATEEPSASRQAYAAENNRAVEEAKTKRLARKLNWVIAGLVVGIIIVFLILFLTP
ncbi:hypothetical protein N7X57_09080 [Lactiplantibacillus paraplantarum]|uniref:hypothetical protein n=1 Tax=Lactiplantibacillus paraplantarum TaxID=60520 RepID=UPI0005132E68|nr:hypothetical protein [Lactiplantibacillus paraplantarum]OAX75437.1 hypothetical protein A0U96_06705 [Lactiplantibacillus plantarum]ALO04552.1 hypothetical protein ASU28_09375 [Lactiplantibacillus paraplantarum]KGE75487.1 hypothetical protein HR47_06800 [Lactiplantibacillus paraplantarum]MCT4457190.1 hypothetical protein [Lactiplantibacillus paraplantarum]MCW1910601.1 hypothetical protein [Lactiplantibacillus paraplantarum]